TLTGRSGSSPVRRRGESRLPTAKEWWCHATGNPADTSAACLLGVPRVAPAGSRPHELTRPRKTRTRRESGYGNVLRSRSLRAVHGAVEPASGTTIHEARGPDGRGSGRRRRVG